MTFILKSEFVILKALILELLFGSCTLLPQHVSTVWNQTVKSITMLFLINVLTFAIYILYPIQYRLASLRANLKLQTCTQIMKQYVMWTGLSK